MKKSKNQIKTISLKEAIKISDYENSVKKLMANLLMNDFGKDLKYLFKQTSKIALPNYIIIIKHILNVSLKGKNYDIPLLIYFPDSFPLSAPEIYLEKKSNHIQINKSIPNYFISQKDLRVNFQLYKKWKKMASSIHEILDYLIDIFNRFFPLFSCKEGNNFSGYCELDYNNSILIVENNNSENDENNSIKKNEKNNENNNLNNNENDKNNKIENNEIKNENNNLNNNENDKNNTIENNENKNENNNVKNSNNENVIDTEKNYSSIITPKFNDNDFELNENIIPNENDELNTPSGDFIKDSIFEDTQIKKLLIDKLNKTLKKKIEKEKAKQYGLYNKLINCKNKINNEIKNLNPILEAIKNDKILNFQKDLEIISKKGDDTINIINNYNNLNIIDKSNQLIQISNPKYLQRKIKIKAIEEFISICKKAISERMIKLSDVIKTIQKLNSELFKLRLGLFKYPNV